MSPASGRRVHLKIVNRIRLHRSVPRSVALALLLAPALSRPATVDNAAAADCAAGSSYAQDAACQRSSLSRFQPPDNAAAVHAVPANQGLTVYDPAANRPRMPGSPEAALQDVPSVFTRTMRWLASAMVMVGVGMMVARSWIRDRIRKSDAEATVEARRMLREAEQPRVLLAPAPAPSRRIQWTADRIGALDGDDYARLCAGFWETRGYDASLERPGSAPGRLIELRRMQDRKALQGLVCCLPQDDGRSGLDAVRRLSDARHRSDVAMAVVMTRGALSGEAAALATQHALQIMDEAALLMQLRTLTQDQQEALFAELDAYTPSNTRTPLESSLT